MLKTETLTCLWFPAVRLGAFSGKTPEEHPPCRLGRQTAPKDLHAYLERAVEVLGISFVLKCHDTVVHKARQIGFALPVSLRSPLDPEVQDIVEIGSKDGALPHYWGTSPPSALRTGQATPRGIRLASEGLRRAHVAVPGPVGVPHEVSCLCTRTAGDAFTCGPSPWGRFSIPPWGDATPTTTLATLR